MSLIHAGVFGTLAVSIIYTMNYLNNSFHVEQSTVGDDEEIPDSKGESVKKTIDNLLNELHKEL